MGTMLLQFTLCAINLFVAKGLKRRGGNPSFGYFVAGMTFGFGIAELFKLI
jgi:hypothetical protein